MSKIYKKSDLIKCGNCKKELDTNMELEYSETLCTLFCCPDCATTAYYDYMASIPVDEQLLAEKGYVIHV